MKPKSRVVTFLMCLSPCLLPSLQIAANSQETLHLTRYKTLEDGAYAACTNDPEAIRLLAHEIIINPHCFILSSAMADSLEKHLAAAEVNFRTHRVTAVSETQLVNLLNDVRETLQLPTYLTTTPAQLRHLRMRLAVESPLLMGSGCQVKVLNEATQYLPASFPCSQHSY